ncbi:hypothetical protein OAK10_04035 [Candidatus Pelagibacter sp.]|nr:hypothetical protein [Candidatus Pelagibacter sp.]
MMRNKIYDILILILFFLLSSIKIVNADCNFKIRLGEDVLKIKNFVDINTEENLILEDYSISYLDVCPNENLDENTNVSYTFIDDELANIRIVVNNFDENNDASNTLKLMKYVKQNFGDFDTGQNPKIYNYFNSWKINSEIIIYKRIRNQFNIIEEELFITNEKYDEKMNRINARIEKGEIKR